jgi:hypothetical protein
MEATYLWPPWLSDSYHPRCGGGGAALRCGQDPGADAVPELSANELRGADEGRLPRERRTAVLQRRPRPGPPAGALHPDLPHGEDFIQSRYCR